MALDVGGPCSDILFRKFVVLGLHLLKLFLIGDIVPERTNSSLEFAEVVLGRIVESAVSGRRLAAEGLREILTGRSVHSPTALESSWIASAGLRGCRERPLPIEITVQRGRQDVSEVVGPRLLQISARCGRLQLHQLPPVLP